MILVNSGAFLSISSWFCELTELIFVMKQYISSTGYPPTTQGIMGHVQVANAAFCTYIALIELKVEVSLAIMSARICCIPSETCFTSLIPANIHVHLVLLKNWTTN